TTMEFSRIEGEYNASDRCRFHVACPHCGEMQWLQWGADKTFGLKWSKDDAGLPLPGSARYVCQHNGCEIREHEKSHMLRTPAEGPMGVVVWGLFVRTLGVDVQGDRIKAFDWAWGRGMESQLVERRVFHGDPALPETEEGSPWARLTEYRRTPVLHASGRSAPL